jgi:nucleoside-diphosphate-sugar epimerase
MRVFVTGANGFLGSAVVDRLVATGDDVVALVRTPSSAPDHWAASAAITVVQGDLRAPRAWSSALAGCDAVVHLAAAKAGDFHEQFALTVVGTENLLAAMLAAGLRRLVHISTFSVYDYLSAPVGSRLTESSTLEQHPTTRDEYAQVKLVQEQLVREFGGDVTIIRPGLIYGPDAWWNGGRVMRLAGTWWLAIAPEGVMKLTHVRNCADAIVLAVHTPSSSGATLNIVDDHLPTQREYERILRAAGLLHGGTLAVPWRVAFLGATVLQWCNDRLFAGRAKLPGVLVPAKQAARCKPLTYDHTLATEALGWTPRIPLAEAIRQASRPPVDSADVPGVGEGK